MPPLIRSLAGILFPLPKSLSQSGRGTLKGHILDLAPLLPFWEKGLGDEGDSYKRSIGSNYETSEDV
jgi:hypothetical protein